MKWLKHIFGFAFYLIVTLILNRFAIEKLGAMPPGGGDAIGIIFTALAWIFVWIFFGLLYAGLFAGSVAIGGQFKIMHATVSGVFLSILIGCYQVAEKSRTEQILNATADREMNERVQAEYKEMNILVLAAKEMNRQKIEDGLARLKFRTIPDALCKLTQSSATTGGSLIRIDGVVVENPEPLNEEQLLYLAESMSTLHVAKFDMQQILISILVEIGMRRAPKESFLSRWIAIWKAAHPLSTTDSLALVEPIVKKVPDTNNGCSHKADEIVDTISHYWGANGIKMATNMGLIFTTEQKTIALQRAHTASDFRTLKDAGILLTDVPNQTWLPSVLNGLYGKLIGERWASGTKSPPSEVAEVVEELARQRADFAVVDERGDNICAMVLHALSCECAWQTNDEKEARIEAASKIQKTVCPVKGN